jgi:hypothetical protein
MFSSLMCAYVQGATVLHITDYFCLIIPHTRQRLPPIPYASMWRGGLPFPVILRAIPVAA